MQVSSLVQRKAAHRAGFSLIELSIVVAILSIVSVLGLEVATSFISRNTYTATKQQLAKVDEALHAFYNVYGRLPCPASRGLDPANTAYGLENCGLSPLSGTGITAGALPFRTLNMPASASMDNYGSKLHYFVTQGLTATATFPTTLAAIEVRSGKLAASCSGNCSVMANPDMYTGAAYAVFSSGADQRGAVSKQGNIVNGCTKTNDSRIDAQNCMAIFGGSLAYSISGRVLYDSRFNPGTQDDNYFDDIMVWRPKGSL